MSTTPANSIPDIQLGLTNDEIALLRHHQAAASYTGSSSRSASRASSHGSLLLDGSSWAALNRHFDRLIQQIQTQLDHLSEQSQLVSNQQYDRAGNAIAIHDTEIARFHDILRQIDELEVDFDRIMHIRAVVRSHHQLVEKQERERELGRPSSKSTVRGSSRNAQRQTLVLEKEGRRQSKSDSAKSPRNARNQSTVLAAAANGEVKSEQKPQATQQSYFTGAIPIGPPTDSGYASVTHEGTKHTQNIRPGNHTKSIREPQSQLYIGHEAEPSSGSTLEKITISGGKFITGGAEFALGKRDTPVHISRNGYVPKLKWISKKFVVLWDEEDKRGRLINGTSALLHLMRSSLEPDSTDKFNSQFLFKQEEMQEPREPHKADSAIEVLLNSVNKKLNIYPEREDYLRLEDRVEHFYNILEKIIDHQVNVAGQNGVKLKLRARKTLEGWDFKDLATDRDPLYPRVTILQTVGKGWVDFTRSIHAITLFGRGFGEIIQPATTSLCNRWSKLPTGSYYLAASVSDIREIMGVCGNEHSNPMKLTDNIIWHTEYGSLGPCQCTRKKPAKHSDLVQVLFPSKFRSVLPKKNPVQLNPHGAVIFGHNVNFKWYWRDTEDPVKGELLLLPKEPSTQFHDSGLGSSLGSSETEGSRDLTESNSQDPPDSNTSSPSKNNELQMALTMGSTQRQPGCESSAGGERAGKKRSRRLLSK